MSLQNSVASSLGYEGRYYVVKRKVV